MFAVPGDDVFTHDITLLATDDLSIAGYYVTAPVTPRRGSYAAPEIRLGSVDIDAYNAPDLNDDHMLVREPVKLPYAAVQNGLGAVADGGTDNSDSYRHNG